MINGVQIKHTYTAHLTTWTCWYLARMITNVLPLEQVYVLLATARNETVAVWLDQNPLQDNTRN